MERDPQRGSGSFVESADLIGVPRAALAILAQLRELRVDLCPATVTAELVRDLRIIQAQLARHDALCGPLTALAEPYEEAALGFDAHPFVPLGSSAPLRRCSAASRRR